MYTSTLFFDVALRDTLLGTDLDHVDALFHNLRHVNGDISLHEGCTLSNEMTSTACGTGKSTNCSTVRCTFLAWNKQLHKGIGGPYIVSVETHYLDDVLQNLRQLDINDMLVDALRDAVLCDDLHNLHDYSFDLRHKEIQSPLRDALLRHQLTRFPRFPP